MKKVQISCLGKLGRFGNSLYQYAFARAYAEKHGAVLETNNWIGRKLFKDINDPLITKQLPRTIKGGIPWGRTEIDFYGYYQSQECLNILNAAKVRDWYTFKDKWVELFPCQHSIVAFLRRGDYVTKFKDYFCIISEQSYLRAFSKFDIDHNKVHWVTGENPPCPDAESIGAEYLPNFFTLMNANHFFRANSTFCLWAGFLGGGKVYSPVVGDLIGSNEVEFIGGNHPRIAGKAVEFPPANFVIRD